MKTKDGDAAWSASTETGGEPETQGGLGCVVNTGLTNMCFGSVAMAGLTGDFSDLWPIRELVASGQGVGFRPGKKLRDRREW